MKLYDQTPWPTNIVSVVSHARLERLGTSQITSIVHPWSLDCTLLPLQESLNYFPYEIQKKKLHAITINQLTTNFFHCLCTNFDQGKLFPEKFFITLLFQQLITKQK